MTADILAQRTFTLADQQIFARLTGDANPIHVDPLAARRSLAGAPLVHGVHLLVWGLDALCRHLEPSVTLCSLRVNFEKMVPIGTRVEAVLADRKADRVRLEIRLDGRPAAVVLVGLSTPAQRQPVFLHGQAFTPSQPLSLSLAEMAALAGHVVPWPEATALADLFPALVSRIGQRRITGLAAATFIVGMVCPGLHSIFRSLDLAAAEEAAVDEALHFAVSSLDERFRMVRIALSGAGWTGRIDAHIRPEPVVQPAMPDIAARIGATAFAGVRALVVGGSRGLGETLAKVLAAGSAEVAITYRIGKDDAERVAREIRETGGRCHVLAYDATAGVAEGLRIAGFSPNQLYYLATPTIRPGNSAYNAARFVEYAAFYVDGFARVVEMVAASADEKLDVFYPSTVFIEDAPTGFAEYAMAKAAGELLCREFQSRGIVRKVLVERLPRLLTDQTRTLAEESFPDTVDVLAGIAMKMHRGAIE